jgi:hypothetical protein
MNKLFPLENYTKTHSKRSKKYSISKEEAKYIKTKIKKKIKIIFLIFIWCYFFCTLDWAWDYTRNEKWQPPLGNTVNNVQ